MDKLQIKSESLPERCEICHREDCFDPQNNYCSRCGNTGDIEKNSDRSHLSIVNEPRPAIRLSAVNSRFKAILFWRYFLITLVISFLTGTVIFYGLRIALGRSPICYSDHSIDYGRFRYVDEYPLQYIFLICL